MAPSRIFITGSADGLGLMAGRKLTAQGHTVVLHARSEARAADAQKALPQAAQVVVGDVSTLAAIRSVAEQVNGLGRFDAVIHNVALGYQESGRNETPDGVSQLFAVNVVAPYLLTALIQRPKRLIYLSSGMHRGGDTRLQDIQWSKGQWNGSQAYSDTKLHDALLAFAVARRWADVLSNAVDPGWVATRMGGKGAPDDLDAGAATQAWLATSDDSAATVSGQLFYHQRTRAALPAAHDFTLQDRLLDYCRELTQTALPA